MVKGYQCDECGFTAVDKNKFILVNDITPLNEEEHHICSNNCLLPFIKRWGEFKLSDERSKLQIEIDAVRASQIKAAQ